jgi:Ca2+-binding RTX toxin-like protein
MAAGPAALLAPAAAPAAAATLCAGLPVTIAGTPDDDVLSGTPGPDVVNGLAGDDGIDGAEGTPPDADRFVGGTGARPGQGVDVCRSIEATPPGDPCDVHG